MLLEFDASIEAVTLTLTCFTQEEVPLCFGCEIVRFSLTARLLVSTESEQFPAFYKIRMQYRKTFPQTFQN